MPDISPERGPALLIRPGLVTLLAVLHFIVAALYLCIGLGLLALGARVFGELQTVGPALAIGAFCLAASLLHGCCGLGLWKLRPYGRILQIILSCIGLLGFPIGTIMGVLILIYLNKPQLKLLFSGRLATDMTPDELSLAAARDSAAVLIVAVVIVGIVGLVAVGSIVAAIAVPALLRARMTGNETSALASIRSLQSQEATTMSTSGAFADTAFHGTKNGYAFTFFPGASLMSYAYVATPVSFGSTGTRGFCGDNSGRLCQVYQAQLTADAGLCPLDCENIQNAVRAGR